MIYYCYVFLIKLIIMSKLANAPLEEVVFEIKWGKSKHTENKLQLEFTPEEQSLMPGKFQIYAEEKGFKHNEVKKNQPPFPHLVKYRFSEKDGSYPIYQLGTGVFAINQIDTDKYEYDWKVFKKDVKKGIKIFSKSYPSPISDLPLIEIRLHYRDVVVADKDECLFDFINNKLKLGENSLPDELDKDPNIDISCPSGSFSFQLECEKPKGIIVCDIKQGLKEKDKAYIIDFLVVSKPNVFHEITSETLMNWCKEAHKHQSTLFKAFFDKELMDKFK